MKRRAIRRQAKAKQKQNLAEPEKQLSFWLRFISASGIICNGARATCGGWHFPNREVIEFMDLISLICLLLLYYIIKELNKKK